MAEVPGHFQQERLLRRAAGHFLLHPSSTQPFLQLKPQKKSISVTACDGRRQKKTGMTTSSLETIAEQELRKCHQRPTSGSLNKSFLMPNVRLLRPYSASPRNGNCLDGNHLEICLSSSQNNRNCLTWVLVASTVCFTFPVLYRVSAESRAGEWEL